MKKKVLVIGDAMVDRYVHGRAERLSPEAPALVLNVQREFKVPGGAANVAMNIAAQDVPVGLITLTGSEDEGADWLFRHLASNNIWARGVPARGYKVPVKNRFVSGTQQLMRFDEESPIPEGDRFCTLGGRIQDLFAEVVSEIGVLVLSDYNKGTLTAQSAPRLIYVARQAGIPVIVAPRGDWAQKYNGADAIVANWTEAMQFMQSNGRPVAAEGDNITAVTASELIGRTLGCQQVVITAGAHGLFWYDRIPAPGKDRGSHHHVPTEERQVFDATGAGDTVLAVMAAETLTGTPMAESVVRANAAAGVAVSKPGTVTVSRIDIENELGWGATGLRRVVRLDRAKEMVERYKKDGKSVGFVFGDFHQLTPGHVRFLRKSRDECDFLVAGVLERSADKANALVPHFQPLDARLEVLAAVDSVDMVVPVPLDNVFTVAKALAPDYLFITEKHEGGAVADVVEDRGGRVRIFPRQGTEPVVWPV